MNPALIKEEAKSNIPVKISSSLLLYPRQITSGITCIWGGKQGAAHSLQKHYKHTFNSHWRENQKGCYETLQSLGAGPFPACPLAPLGLQHHPFLEEAEADGSDTSVLTKALLDPHLPQHLKSIFMLHSLISFLSNALHRIQA